MTFPTEHDINAWNRAAEQGDEITVTFDDGSTITGGPAGPMGDTLSVTVLDECGLRTLHINPEADAIRHVRTA